MALDKLPILQAKNLHKSDFKIFWMTPSGSEWVKRSTEIVKNAHENILVLNFIFDIGFAPTIGAQ